MNKGTSGTSMNAIEESKERKKRRAKARKRQEKYWASKAGPVVVTYKDKALPE